MRLLPLLILPGLLAGCISYTSKESRAPDFAASCAGKETQCREICASAGVQTYSCKAAAREGMDYKCECKKP